MANKIFDRMEKYLKETANVLKEYTGVGYRKVEVSRNTKNGMCLFFYYEKGYESPVSKAFKEFNENNNSLREENPQEWMKKWSEVRNPILEILNKEFLEAQEPIQRKLEQIDLKVEIIYQAGLDGNMFVEIECTTPWGGYNNWDVGEHQYMEL